jgi:hypothetical protein
MGSQAVALPGPTVLALEETLMYRVAFVVGVLLMTAVPSSALGDEPLTLAASNVGNFAQGSSWHLSVNSAGKAELTIATRASKVRRQFDVPKEQLAVLRKALMEEKFFDLTDEYGQRVPDGSTQTLTVTVGDRAKSVKVRFLMNWIAANEKDKLREPSRAVRLLVLVRGWFADAEAVDLRPYDQKVLEAAK